MHSSFFNKSLLVLSILFLAHAHHLSHFALVSRQSDGTAEGVEVVDVATLLLEAAKK